MDVLYFDYVVLHQISPYLVSVSNLIIFRHDHNSSIFSVQMTEASGPAFEEFLDLIGTRIVLKGFEGYRAQLDNRSKFWK